MMTVQSLPPSLARALREATTGERVVWVARPNDRRQFFRNIWTFLFSIPWTVFSIAWTAVPASVLLFAEGPDPMKGWGRAAMVVFFLFGLPFVAVGLVGLATPFLAARRARHTVFALTDTRLAVIFNGRTLVVRSIPLSTIFAVECRHRRNGRGDLHLDLGSRRDSDGDLVRGEEVLAGLDDVGAAERQFRAELDRLARSSSHQARSA